ncbi:MAG: cell division protein FtsQ [Prevotella sp.]|nr:cell division protein FtsQ [Prevotella sp.]
MNWKKSVFIVFNAVLGAYVVLAMTAFNKPDQKQICRDVVISIEEGVMDGFLTTSDVKHLMETDGISPVGQLMSRINLRTIEETLQAKELVEACECYKGQDGTVCINIRQRIPVIRVMNDKGEDFFVDTHGKPMPRTDYSCNLIVATGHASKQYAEKWLAPLANYVLTDTFWKNQIVQLNVLADGSVEIVPRVGDHIAYLGQPVDIDQKLDRLRKFYRYGLNKAGWNKYSRISVEFGNQIVCTRKPLKR